ncbi:MAG: YifB family Mg chelatase-like AAA ATPase [Armatimonadetes bacterium]|nr:YifB family Mg chelatase-like AAA ATPase [Armatimonadota bacterium]
MLAQVESSALLGVNAYPVKVEVYISNGLPQFHVVGLPDAAVQESRERVRAAIRNSGYYFPAQRITVNLAPADTRKEGPAFDLPIALGILAATGQIVHKDSGETVVVGELSLEGAVNPVSGVLPIALHARQTGKKRVIVPARNRREATVVGEVAVYPVDNLAQVVGYFNHPETPPPSLETEDPALSLEPSYPVDFADVKGQEHVKRALEVAAAGGHNLIMVGPPGSGKTMLARRLPTILPALTLEEALDVTKIYSVSGSLPAQSALITARPFRSPHHTISDAGLVGGGSVPRPGEVSLAHHGVLFLDEMPEFRRDALEVMRQPIEDGSVTIARVSATLTYPAQFMLVSAMNPCPCGFFGDPLRQCACAPQQIHRYLQKVSGPLLDRIDIHIEVPRLKQEELLRPLQGEGSQAIRQRIEAARRRQAKRFQAGRLHCNARMTERHLHECCPLSEEVKGLLRAAINQLNLSARAYDRILKVSRTIADLEGTEQIGLAHVAEAVQYRSLDRKFWG